MGVLRTYLNTLGRCGVAAVAVGAAGGNHLHGAAVHVALPVGIQALAAVAGSLQAHLAAVLGVDGVAFHGGSALGLTVFVDTSAGGYHRGASAVDGDVALAVDALGAVGRHLHVQHAAVDVDAVVGLDAVVSRRLGVDVHAGAGDDVVGTVDGVVVVAIDLQGAVAVQQQLALAVEGTLVVVLRRGAVSQGAGAVEHDVGPFPREQVQGGRVGVGDADAVQLHLVFLVADDGERAVGGGAADHVAHRLHRAVVGGDVASADAYRHAVVVGLSRGTGQVDGYLGGERVVGQVILRVGEILCHGGRRLGGGLVDGHAEGQQVGAGTATAAIEAAAIGIVVVAAVDSVVVGGVVADGVVGRAALQDAGRYDDNQ